MITLTDKAVTQLQTMLADDPEKSGQALRIFVENGGCAGMQYGMKFDTPSDGDETVGREGVQVTVDKESLKYIDGSELDYNDELTASGFKIHNPKAVRSCGCGTSFETSEEN